jgi:hypothetical protein
MEAWVMQTCCESSFRFFLLLTFAFLVVDVGHSNAHDDLAWQMLADNDASRAEWFEKLKTSSGESCCNLSDCRQTQAEWRGDTDGWWAVVQGTWRPIPADKVLTSPRSIDGAAYICMGKDSRGDGQNSDANMSENVPSLLGAIYCFVPPDLGS